MVSWGARPPPLSRRLEQAKMLSSSYKKRQRPPFITYWGEGEGGGGAKTFSAPYFLFCSAAADEPLLSGHFAGIPKVIA